MKLMTEITSSGRPGADRAGFTLLELMLAITILAVVITAVYTTFTTSLNAWKRSIGVSDALQRQRIVMDTLSELTKSMVFVNSRAGLYSFLAERNVRTGDSVSFVTASDVLLPPTEAVAAGMRRVTISMQYDERGWPYLALQNAPALETSEEDQGQLHVLSADVSGFAIRYRDPRTGQWQEEWDEAGLIPSAIEYTIAFGGLDGRTPPIIMTRAVDLPIAQFVMQNRGEALAQQDTATEVRRRDDINLSGTGSASKLEADTE